MHEPDPSVREFPVTTNFQIEVHKPGGLPRSIALRQAQRNLATLTSEFPTALDRHIEALRNANRSAGRGDPAWRHRLRQECTDLYDAATMIGYGLIAAIAANLRDVCASATIGMDNKIVAGHIAALCSYGDKTFQNLSLVDVPELDALRDLVQPDRVKPT